MEFNFSPKLPKSNLDDRTFEDLVSECLLRIPRYCPEWTNYNASDPGVTLIEMFAWLTDQMLFRFNQIPQRNYIAFLEMLGIRLQPGTPAQTNVTFYLTAARTTRYIIPAGVEVATERTEMEEAVVFSTTHPLAIGVPVVRHFLTAEKTDFPIDRESFLLRDRLANVWTRDDDGRWSGREQPLFNERPDVGNCFYLVFDADEPLDGNVIALTLKGEPAESTGIDPEDPPRTWEAWDGRQWQKNILRTEDDDGTRGFSFKTDTDLAQGVMEADVILHLPLKWPSTHVGDYHGRLLRCVHDPKENTQAAYSRSPKLQGISARSIGATAHTHQCSIIKDELLGKSDGNPGQKFQLQSSMILPRNSEEFVVVSPPKGLPQNWQEVNDFADSEPEDRHYTLDSITGEIQFAPLVREAAKLKEDNRLRTGIQATTASDLSSLPNELEVEKMKRHYGAIPPKGSIIRMASYRSGGGKQGNVQAGSLKILKSAVPYVREVINYEEAKEGTDAESLEDAMIRVPRSLRTRDRAVTAEDFEALALQSSRRVARAQCPPENSGNGQKGVVNLLIVPDIDTTPIENDLGISPKSFSLSESLKKEVLAFLGERKLLGIDIQLQEPEYVGVSVQLEVGLEHEYCNREAREKIKRTLNVQLYRFLNPITGGITGAGWSFGNPLYTSDIVSLLQKVSGIRYLGSISLFELRQRDGSWVRTLVRGGTVDPGPQGLICSWNDPILRSGHTIGILP